MKIKKKYREEVKKRDMNFKPDGMLSEESDGNELSDGSLSLDENRQGGLSKK